MKPITNGNFSVSEEQKVSGYISNHLFFFSALPDKDENGHDIIDEYSSLPFPSQYYNRLKDKIWTTKKTIEDPFSDRLLPDPLEEPYIQPKYTICLELTGLLVHSSWTVSTYLLTFTQFY